LPQYQDKVFTFSQPAFFGEIALMFWLLIKGANPKAINGSSLLGGGRLGALLAFDKSGVRPQLNPVAGRGPYQPSLRVGDAALAS
jgi:hypothetical protein